MKQATLRTSGGLRFDARLHLAAKGRDSGDRSGRAEQRRSGLGCQYLPDAGARRGRGSAHPPLFDRNALARRAWRRRVTARRVRRAGGGQQDGAILLELGWTDLGYDLADGATGFVLLGPQTWFERKVAALRGASGDERKSAAERLASLASLSPAERRQQAEELAAQCGRALGTCDDRAIGSLLEAAGGAGERSALSGIVYAPLLATAAQQGRDGTGLDPLVVGSAAEALKLGGGSTLDHLAVTSRAVAASDADAARGQSHRPQRALIVPFDPRARTTSARSLRRRGQCTFVTPFVVIDGPADALTSLRGVFVQWYGSPALPPSQSASLVLVGAFAR